MYVLHLVVMRTSDAGVDGDAGVVEEVHAGRRVEDRIPQHPAEQHQAHAEPVPARNKTKTITHRTKASPPCQVGGWEVRGLDSLLVR